MDRPTIGIEPMRESTVEKHVNRFAEDHGIKSIKLNGPGERGKADRMFCKDGKAIFIELKRPGKRATELQVKWLCEMQALGFFANWTDSPGQAIMWIVQEFGLE